MKKTDPIEQAANTWNQLDINRVRDVSWLAIPILAKSYGRVLTGERTLVNMIEDELLLRLENQTTNLRGAAIACGDMTGERNYFEKMDRIRFKTVHGFDISEVSLGRYKPHGIQFKPFVMDINDLILEKENYDLIVFSHGVHHIYNLGGLFYQVNKALKKKGLLVVTEWIGPNYLQIPLRNHLISTLLLYLLWPNANSRKTHEGLAKGIWLQYPPQSFDPSEACNSEELEKQLLKYFKPLRVIKYGGLCYPVFEGRGYEINKMVGFGSNTAVKLVFWLERILTKMRIVQPLFLQGIFEKNDNIMIPNEKPKYTLLRRGYHFMKRLIKNIEYLTKPQKSDL